MILCKANVFEALMTSVRLDLVIPHMQNYQNASVVKHCLVDMIFVWQYVLLRGDISLGLESNLYGKAISNEILRYRAIWHRVLIGVCKCLYEQKEGANLKDIVNSWLQCPAIVSLRYSPLYSSALQDCLLDSGRREAAMMKLDRLLLTQGLGRDHRDMRPAIKSFFDRPKFMKHSYYFGLLLSKGGDSRSLLMRMTDHLPLSAIINYLLTSFQGAVHVDVGIKIFVKFWFQESLSKVGLSRSSVGRLCKYFHELPFKMKEDFLVSRFVSNANTYVCKLHIDERVFVSYFKSIISLIDRVKKSGGVYLTACKASGLNFLVKSLKGSKRSLCLALQTDLMRYLTCFLFDPAVVVGVASQVLSDIRYYKKHKKLALSGNPSSLKAFVDEVEVTVTSQLGVFTFASNFDMDGRYGLENVAQVISGCL